MAATAPIRTPKPFPTFPRTLWRTIHFSNAAVRLQCLCEPS
jgi:hypothetical protein